MMQADRTDKQSICFYPLFLIGLFIFLYHLPAVAQIEVVADGRLQTLLEQHIAYSEASKTIRGFRIKVATFTGQGAKNKAYSVRDKLQLLYPLERTYVTFDEPHFIIRFGDYITRLEAYRNFADIKALYPTAIITRDFINLPPLTEEDLKQPEYFEPDESEVE
ncbi:MAG: hypothetical protein LBR28_07570 [Bacteroidales bacterium]|jgi:hypothetical protein|nr:hypothetical protein [Bacteroidales bacterium]